eukprot:Nk52_evm32s2340 gene=Nk52_evmTU32s2340
MLWDTAGQEEFDQLTQSYYRGANACVLAFSTTDRDSFEAVKDWLAKVKAQCCQGNDSKGFAMVLVQNKIDLIDEAAFEQSEAEDLARELKLKLYRTSVSENMLVDEVFQYLSEKCLKGLKVEEDIDAMVPEQKAQIGKMMGMDDEDLATEPKGSVQAEGGESREKEEQLNQGPRESRGSNSSSGKQRKKSVEEKTPAPNAQVEQPTRKDSRGARNENTSSSKLQNPSKRESKKKNKKCTIQ